MRSALMIGITGPIGAGKSTVGRILRELGATVLDADGIVRDLQRPGQAGHAQVVEIFGPDVLGADGQIDRPKLAQLVFADRTKLTRLEEAMHPLVVAQVLDVRASLPPTGILVVEAIKLLQSKIRDRYDEIWVVLAPRPSLLARLRERGLSEAESERRLANQPGDLAFRAAASVVIENTGDLSALRAQVEERWNRVRARAV
jgi:dephospho-CoA kinase